MKRNTTNKINKMHRRFFFPSKQPSKDTVFNFSIPEQIYNILLGLRKILAYTERFYEVT